MRQGDSYKLRVFHGHELNAQARNYNALIGEFVARLIPGAEHAEDFGAYQSLGFADSKGLVAGVVFLNYKQHAVDINLGAINAKWASRAAFKMISHFAYEGLAVNRLHASVGKRNKRSRKLLEGVGFKLEGCLKKGFSKDEDMMIYGMVRDDCPWIGKKENGIYRRSEKISGAPEEI